MGWGDVISIGLGLGNLAVNASNANTLQQMKMQQVGEQLMREFLTALRNGMFKLNQTAEDILRSEATAPLQAAGAMRILEYQLSSSGITPDLFNDLADKKFAADTARLIGDNSNRMYAALDKGGQSQVNQLVDAVRRLPDYHYYLDNIERVRRLEDAKTVVSNAGIAGSNSCLMSIGFYLAFGLLVALAAAFDGTFGVMLLVAGIAGLIVLAVQVGRRRKGLKEAKGTINALEADLDMPRFRALEMQLQPREKALAGRQQDEQYVENFFGDYSLLQEGWIS